MERGGSAKSLDRRNLLAYLHGGKREARVDPLPVRDGRACTALAMIAALLGASEVQVLAQRVQQQRGACVEIQIVALAVDPERDLGID